MSAYIYIGVTVQNSDGVSNFNRRSTLVCCPTNNLPFCVSPRGQMPDTVCRGIARLLLKRVTPQMAPWRHAQQFVLFKERERVSRPIAALRRFEIAGLFLHRRRLALERDTRSEMYDIYGTGH